MTGPILARVRRVLIGHSERALVHAVDDAGLEYKIEVPTEAVQGDGRAHVLEITWSLRPAAETTTPTESQSIPVAPASVAMSPNAVDQEFMALMARGRLDVPAAPTAAMENTTTPTTAPINQLAALLGIQTRSG